MSVRSARSYAPRRLRGYERRLYGIYLAHYAVRALLAEAAVEAELDPDRLSFSEGLFELTEMLSLALTVEPEEKAMRLPARVRHKMAWHVLPPRRLRINRREIKQIYHTYKPKKRGVPPPEPFEPAEQFLDFVELLDPLAPALPRGESYVRCIGRTRPHTASAPRPPLRGRYRVSARYWNRLVTFANVGVGCMLQYS